MVKEDIKKDYLVFINKKTKKKLAFYPVAKNANTSAKLFLIRHLGIEEKFFYIENIPRHKHTKQMYDNFKNQYDNPKKQNIRLSNL